MKLIVLLLAALSASAQTPFVSTRLASLNFRGVYQIREITNAVPFSVFTLLMPSNSSSAIMADFSAETSAGTSRAIQSGQIRLVALNVNGVITSDQMVQNEAEIQTSGSLAVEASVVSTSTNITMKVTMTDSARTNRVFNYRVANLDTNILAAPFGLPLIQ